MKHLFLLLPMLLMASAIFAQSFYKGVDLSYVNELEDGGAMYYNVEGEPVDPYQLFANKGANVVRLRLWHTPQWTNYSKYADVVKSIKRAKNTGMEVILDLHYSDFWADPARQWCPEAWNSITSDIVMGDSIYNYTYQLLQSLADSGLLPEMVQIGNEINGNICQIRTTEAIDGNTNTVFPLIWSRQVALLHKGIKAVDDINSSFYDSIKTIVHIAQPENGEWWFREAIQAGLTAFDIIGLSYYPEWSDYDVSELGSVVHSLVTNYNKEVMIVETGYPWTLNSNDNASNVLGSESLLSKYGADLSPGAQRDYLLDLCYAVKGNGGSGVVYWEPAWVSTGCKTFWATGSHYENAALFDYDNKIHEGADFFSSDYTKLPDVEVTFIVDMNGVDTTNGVYITGDFTGDSDWSFIRMQHIGDMKFKLNTAIPSNSKGAYSFYNNNLWDEQYRETVPVACVEYWGTHRGYEIYKDQITYAFSWGACDLKVHTTVGRAYKKSSLFLYPTVSNDQILIQTNEPISTIGLSGVNGKSFKAIVENEQLQLSNLPSGMYLLTIQTTEGVYTEKFLKR